MLSSGSGCSPMTSSPLISPRLWESRLTLLKVWRPPRPSDRCTCAGHLWRWWVGYAPNFPGSTTWLCEPPLACLFPCHSCALHTLSRDLQVWRRGYLVPLAFRRSSMFPEGNVPGYVCNPGSPRERDAASQGHTSGIPTRAMLHWNLEAGAGCTSRAFKHPGRDVTAPDVWPSILTDYTYDSELDNADGVPLAFRRSVSFPRGTRVTYVTWDVFNECILQQYKEQYIIFIPDLVLHLFTFLCSPIIYFPANCWFYTIIVHSWFFQSNLLLNYPLT